MFNISIQKKELLSDFEVGDVFIVEEDKRIIRLVKLENGQLALLDNTTGELMYNKIKNTTDAYNYIRQYYGKCEFATISVSF
jgi:hypothetical protein